jgi:hypothetical protein
MKTTLLSLSIITVALSLVTTGYGQEERPEVRPAERPQGQRGQRGFARMDPVTAALDANGDGIIDQNEIAGASAALKKLDKNGDGKLTQEELRPNLPARVRPGQPQANADLAVTRLMQFDKNSDGKLSKEELPERMQSMMDRGDADKDGFLSKDEIRKLSATQTSSTPNGRGGEGSGEHDDD